MPNFKTLTTLKIIRAFFSTTGIPPPEAFNLWILDSQDFNSSPQESFNAEELPLILEIPLLDDFNIRDLAVFLSQTNLQIGIISVLIAGGSTRVLQPYLLRFIEEIVELPSPDLQTRKQLLDSVVETEVAHQLSLLAEGLTLSELESLTSLSRSYAPNGSSSRNEWLQRQLNLRQQLYQPSKLINHLKTDSILLDQFYQQAVSQDFPALLELAHKINFLTNEEQQLLQQYPFLLQASSEERIERLTRAKRRVDELRRLLGG